MRMTSVELRSLADQLDKLSEVKGITVTVIQFSYGNHDIYVQHSSDQRDGDTYFVVGISDRRQKGAERDSTDRPR